MRLISRLFALFLLITILAFTTLISPTSKADESTCTDACDSQYDLCIQRCGDSSSATWSSCQTNCVSSTATCKNKCHNAIAPVEDPVN